MTSTLAGGVKHPKIYAYTTGQYKKQKWSGGRDGVGLVKVGYTELGDAEARVKQAQGVKAPGGPDYSILLVESAITEDGQAFSDHAVHKALQKAGVTRLDGEWFEATKDEVLAAVQAVRAGVEVAPPRSQNFGMRPEQRRAVKQTAKYFDSHADADHPPQFLWNAKMRFGKTFTAYQLAKKMGWTRVLVLTYKPAVEKAWRDDLLLHKDFEGWRFKGKTDPEPDADEAAPLVWFASFQDVLGTDEDGNIKAKNEVLHIIDWDAVIVDEYHFGAWRDAARSLYLKDEGGDSSEAKAEDTPDLDEDFRAALVERIPLTVRNFLFLSGTPFRALTQGEFLEDQVFNWTYSDEQRAKTNWQEPPANPYEALPKMHLMVYEMPEALRDVALNNQSEFSLTEFFRTQRDHKTDPPVFVHEKEVQQWLDLLRGQDIKGLWANVSNLNRPPLPYEDLNLLAALQHTVWYLPGVDACHAMANLLQAQHNTFYRDYQIIVAAGTKAGIGEAALPPVVDAIGKRPQDTKTITLSCGKLMTGVTVPAWAGIFMLRELSSPETYFQAAFRVQSPWTSTYVDTEQGGEGVLVHKEHCYVLDFSPNRALRQIVDYATRLRADAASERDDEKAIDEFMEFLPVLSFDGSSMARLDASDVIDYLTSGVSSSMLARRWNSPELITLDIAAMERLLANEELLSSLEQIEMFRNITNDLTAMINTNKELKPKQITKEKLTKEETAKKKDAADRRKGLKERLQRFLTRIPAFMYLTDDREKTVKDIIQQVEPGLFQKVTGLTLPDFQQLVDAQVFDDAKMNDAVWKFRTFEEPSLHYDTHYEAPEIQGGWTLRRDTHLARLIDLGILQPGDTLTNPDHTASATITEDYGIGIDGLRYTSPDDAAQALTGDKNTDGWTYWQIAQDSDTLADLLDGINT